MNYESEARVFDCLRPHKQNTQAFEQRLRKINAFSMGAHARVMMAYAVGLRIGHESNNCSNNE